MSQTREELPTQARVGGAAPAWRVWLRTARIPTLAATFTPIFVGTAIAGYDGAFNVGLFALTLLSCLGLQIGTNYFNEYFDYRYELDTAQSLGASGVIFSGEMTAGQVFGGGLGSFIVAAVLGLALIAIRGPVIVLLGVVGLAIGYFYNARPFKFASRGLGDPLVFLAMGVLMVVGAYFVQIPHWSWQAVAASVPVGCLVVAILNINNIRDYDDDRAVGKLTLPVRFGQRFGRRYQVTLVLGAYVTTTIFALLGVLPLLTLAVWVTILPAVRHLRVVLTATDRLALRFGTKQVATLHLRFGVVLALAIVAAALLRH